MAWGFTHVHIQISVARKDDESNRIVVICILCLFLAKRFIYASNKLVSWFDPIGLTREPLFVTFESKRWSCILLICGLTWLENGFRTFTINLTTVNISSSKSYFRIRNIAWHTHTYIYIVQKYYFSSCVLSVLIVSYYFVSKPIHAAYRLSLMRVVRVIWVYVVCSVAASVSNSIDHCLKICGHKWSCISLKTGKTISKLVVFYF